MPRTVLAILSLSALIACDSSADEPSVPLVGTWDLNAYEIERLITSSADQTIPVLTIAGEGGVVVAGTEEGVLRFVDPFEPSGRSPKALVIGSTSANGRVLAPGTELYIDEAGSESKPTLSIRTEQGERRYVADAPAGYTRNGGRITVPEIRFSHNGESVTVSGEITLPTVRLQIGAETAYPVMYADTYEEFESEFTFLEDGRFRATTLHGVGSVEGQWRLDGSEVSFQPSDLNLDGLVFQATLSEGQLQLRRVETVCEEYECLRSAESSTFAREESFTRVRHSVSYVMTRAATAPAP